MNFSANMTPRQSTWTAFLAFLALKHGSLQYEDDGEKYTVWFYDGPEVHVCTIWKGAVPGMTVANGYSQVQNDSDKSDFTTNYQSTANGRINIGRAPTATITNVAASLSAVTVLAANANRVGATIYGDSTGTLYLKFGAGATSTSFTVQIKGDGYYEVPYFYTGIITGAWTNTNGSARVTEVSL